MVFCGRASGDRCLSDGIFLIDVAEQPLCWRRVEVGAACPISTG
jgi:hypothetical protein